MKRHKPRSLLPFEKPSRSSPSTPSSQRPTPPRPKSIPSSKTKRSLIIPPCPSSSSSSWTREPLNIQRLELSLPLTFPTGQTIRWKQTGLAQYTGPIKSHLISLKHMDGEDDSVAFCVHHTPDRLRAVADLHNYLNLSISLADVWKNFSTSNACFAQLEPHLRGACVMRQEHLECLFQFLCSSNNNIKRITNMVGVISSFGDYMGSVGGYDFHEFPSLEQLSKVSEEQLCKVGFSFSFGSSPFLFLCLQTKQRECLVITFSFASSMYLMECHPQKKNVNRTSFHRGHMHVSDYQIHDHSPILR